MTELDNFISAAQAVLNSYDVWLIESGNDADTQMEALRQAVEQVKVDTRTPVAWAVDTPYGRAYSYAPELMKVLDAQNEAINAGW